MDRRSFLGTTVGALALVPQDTVTAPGQPAADPLRIPEAAGSSRIPVGDLDNAAVIKEIEGKLKCTCGCNLDIFTCRTTDFTCAYSPQLHQEVVALYQQGNSPEQIIAAFVEKYGEQALMAPPAEGFNLAGYLVPGLAILAAGGALAFVLLRRHRLQAATPAVATAAGPSGGVSAADMERLKQALDEVPD
jgi:cytochrome c-type biogenesis protein CcmH